MSSSSSAVSFHDVTINRGKNQIVGQASFDVERGCVHALIGHNGAGKTTLMRALGGYIKPSSGEITAQGTTEVLFVGGKYPGDVTVGEIVSYRQRILRAEDPKKILAYTGVAGFLDKRGNTLSTGMAQRLSIALALLARREILVLDEPTSGLDPQGVDSLSDIIEGINKLGTTVIVCSHDLARLESLCDGVTCMQLGKITFSGPVGEASALVRPPGHIIRTDDDRAVLADLHKHELPVKGIARGIHVDSGVDVVGLLGYISRTVRVKEVTVDSGLFDRIHEKYAAFPDEAPGTRSNND